MSQQQTLAPTGVVVKHLDHLNLSVRDLAETLDWYARVFGFQPVEEGVYEGAPWAIVRAGEAMLCLYEYPELELVPNAARQAAGRHGLFHFALRLRGREAWVARARAEGVEFNYAGEISWPHSSSYYVYDPTGYEIEVVFWKDDRIAFA